MRFFGPSSARYEDSSLDSRAYGVDSALKSVAYSALHNLGAEKPTPPSSLEKAILDQINPIVAYCANPLSPDERLGRSNTFVETGMGLIMSPLILGEKSGKVALAGSVITGAIAAPIIFPPHGSDEYILKVIGGGVVGGIGFIGALASAFGVGIAVFRPIHFWIRDQKDEKLLARMPEREQRLREAMMDYLSSNPTDSQLLNAVLSLDEKIREPVLIPHQRLTKRQATIYTNAKQQHPNGIYQLV